MAVGIAENGSTCLWIANMAYMTPHLSPKWADYINRTEEAWSKMLRSLNAYLYLA